MEKDEKRLTEHFRMDEFIYSAMAVELGLNNALPSEVIPAIRNLTVRLLEPLRIYHRQPMYIMSGYRSEELNRLVGGAPMRKPRFSRQQSRIRNHMLFPDLFQSGFAIDQ